MKFLSGAKIQDIEHYVHIYHICKKKNQILLLNTLEATLSHIAR